MTSTRAKLYQALGPALRDAHSDDTSNNTCDVCVAYNEGLYLYAADRYVDSSYAITDVEKRVGELLEAYAPSAEDIADERSSMPDYIKCRDCNATVYHQEDQGRCGACGAAYDARVVENDRGGEGDVDAYWQYGDGPPRAPSGYGWVGNGDGGGSPEG